MVIGILDGNPAICQLLETLLSFAGHTIYASTNPADFVRYIDSFECIVVDYQLAGKRSGAEVIRQVRLAYPSFPAVLISANPIPHAALQGLGDVKILRKPFPILMLLEALTVAQQKSTRPVL